VNVAFVEGWSNGGYSQSPVNPVYGTHDWIAQHALDWLPSQEKWFIQSNLNYYLYGTELPDNAEPWDGIGDTVNHHIYYYANGSLQDDASAVRADQEFHNAMHYMKYGNLSMAAKILGVMTHYIVDVAVFGHVMGSNTDWGPEVHHSDYETYVNERTGNYNDYFNSYLSFDGKLTIISAYDAARDLAYDTTFDDPGATPRATCVWMDENYNWLSTEFRDRCGESLNLAVNYVADVLHTFYWQQNTIRVPEDYATIQAAINAAQPGDRISVAVGTYYEHVVVNKRLDLVGRKGSSPIFDGGGSGIAVTLLPDASGSTISGFVITNYDKGILVLDAAGCNIYDNSFTNMVEDGIAVEGGAAYDNSISSNTFQHTAVGINLMESTVGNSVYQNSISFNDVGLKVETADSIIYGNAISENDVGISVVNSGNLVYWNYFIANAIHADASFSINIWDNGYPMGGNYWSNHPCTDSFSGEFQSILGSDGICDDPYIIDGVNRDNYPLVSSWTPPANNLAVLKVVPSKTVVCQGLSMSIGITVANQASSTLTFNVYVQASSLPIGLMTPTMSRESVLTLPIIWNTFGLVKGDYTIGAEADVAPGETYLVDNVLLDGVVVISMIGDITGSTGGPDGKCDIRDVALVAKLFGINFPHPMYVPNCDLTGPTTGLADGKIDIRDIALVASHFGEVDP
jgi:hypothetical protein